jgi:hypothetical protein
MQSEEDEILRVFRQFLTGMEQRKPDTLQDLVVPNGTMTRLSGGELQQITISALLDMFPRDGSSTLEERTYDPIVHTDGDIAVIWCTYDSGSMATYATPGPTSSVSPAWTVAG